MRQVIGFTNVYYTLWQVGEPYKSYHDKYNFTWKQDTRYIQNLSFDFEAAKAKMVGEYSIDLELRGHTSFTTSLHSGSDLELWQFPFGIEMGRDIRVSSMAKALWHLYLKKEIWNNEIPEHSFKQLNVHWVKPVVYARRRLIELELLVRYKGKYYTPEYLTKVKQREYVDSLLSGCF